MAQIKPAPTMLAYHMNVGSIPVVLLLVQLAGDVLGSV